ncbi:aldo/keto reductase [Companilactobacillus sp.]|jgi:aryl-alcohol dehydrogenase-like predicted oxidoreductase|uniref:aldo/keto reductase n=1 Tax=Companilactobacillus sp. TaxID=2767905 RepID=UPI0025C156C8|nr:aldo/keto reductase [Companilactobacillus sp.]MCH4009673.1 aldo/keto reductase [Companilactobacillus sp.]MCH4052651.1 aldo/keto reductase [Companilactobacillus sp.]MCH4077615.1 aldo/keto reductase [Companilactobacillus sp.]MCH4126191.1 aldo/keto reductase [Companilactobacillus sp.]MCI1311899.1 aldo/keto reductase [Companilactobacillus sp.]
MKYRRFGKTNFNASEVSLGTWQLGSKWGDPFSEDDAQKTLEAAWDNGVNFFDTADVYQDGESQRALAKFIKGKGDKVFVSTKVGRRLDPHVAEGYNEKNLTKFVEDCLTNLDVDALDNVLLHCPPTPVFYEPEVFFTMDKLKKEGKIKNYGVSVEKVEEAMKALDYDISSVEIIYNMFRLRPADNFFRMAKEHDVGIIARVPLASGLLSGKYTMNTTFGKNDHRTTNRHGEEFDAGETFSGVDYATGVKAAQELDAKLGAGDKLAQMALRYILMSDAVSTVIPGASKPEQIEKNVAAADLPAFTHEQMGIVRDIYDKYMKNPVQYKW